MPAALLRVPPRPSKVCKAHGNVSKREAWCLSVGVRRAPTAPKGWHHAAAALSKFGPQLPAKPGQPRRQNMLKANETSTQGLLLHEQLRGLASRLRAGLKRLRFLRFRDQASPGVPL